MSVVRPGDEADYPTSNTPGQGIGDMLSLGSKSVSDNTKRTEHTEHKEASYSKSETTAQSNGASQQIVPQQAGTAGFDRAAQETEAAKAAAGKINVSKAELEETARHVEELQSKAVEEASKALASAQQLQDTQDRAAAKEAAVKKLLGDLNDINFLVNQRQAELDEASHDTDKAKQVEREAQQEVDAYPGNLAAKKEKADGIRKQMDDLNSELARLKMQLISVQDSIQKEETDAQQVRHKVEAVKVQVDAKAGEKQVAEKLVQDAQAKADQIEKQLGQQQQEADAADGQAQQLEGKAEDKSQASQRVKEEKMRAESNFEAKATAVKAQESEAREHWEKAKKFGNEAEQQTEETEAQAMKNVEGASAEAHKSADAKFESSVSTM